MLVFGYIFMAFFVNPCSALPVNCMAHLESNRPIPSIFGRTDPQIIYFHSHTATKKELEAAAGVQPTFEIDLAWAHEAFRPNLKKNSPYIGHPEEFYTILGKQFPAENVTLAEFVIYLKEHPHIKVLLDIKDEAVLPYLEDFVQTIGSDRCIAHAFIKNWTSIPEGVTPEPHWYREDIELFALNEVMGRLGISLIANCRGFSDQHVEKLGLISKMIEDCKACRSVICLGIYYPGAPLPKVDFLKTFNEAGYYAWVNANLESAPGLKTVGMCDDLSRCTRF